MAVTASDGMETKFRPTVLAEVELRLAEDSELKQIFNLADEANYSGIKPQAADFARWTDVVRHRVLEEAIA